ncbi:MAG: 2-hydroxyacyl-CoA dehydratase, partial [Candidatus Lindowbacteria bacterium]|nr:2-hydroxyacyl-CoA dehydratase [Candidatus Lindowbacteria bacterium]
TFLRAATGGITRGLFPQPRAVICTSHLCEAAPKVAEFGARRSHAEFHVVDVPSGLPEQLSEHTIEYVAKQLEQVAGRLCELSGSRLDIDKLREAVDFSNQARKCFSEVYKMRAQVPSPVTGSQFVGMGLMYPWGTKIGVAIAETLRSEIAARIAGGITAIPGGEKHRLMWLHLRPYFETNIMAVMERERRAVIVVDLLGEAYWPELDAQDPFRALAIRILSNPQLAPVAARTKRAVRLAREYRVDGVVHFLHWGCRWNYGQTSLFRNAMAREGAPFLALDGDAVDKRATPSGQLLTRLEGFLELLEHSSPQRDCR